MNLPKSVLLSPGSLVRSYLILFQGSLEYSVAKVFPKSPTTSILRCSWAILPTSRTERDSHLLLFFQTLSQYAQMDRDRSNLINNLAKRFPELVKSNHVLKPTGVGRGTRPIKAHLETLPGGPGVQTLVFCGPRQVNEDKEVCVHQNSFTS